MKTKNKRKKYKDFIHMFALPWCCILPISLAFLGFTGGALGAFLSDFTPLFLVISIIFIGYSNYNVWFGKYKSPNHRIWVTIITIFSILAWLWSLIYVMKWIVI